jgi:REP element-mobilizing transposase RayT
MTNLELAFHIVVRAARRGLLAADALDVRNIVSLVRTASQRYPIRVLALCVMATHYHLLLLAERAAIAAAEKFLNYMYTVYFNARHGTTGHLLEAPYRAFVKPTQEAMLSCARYIHLNPLDAVSAPDLIFTVEGSTLGAYTGEENLDWLDLRLLQAFDKDPVLARLKYRNHVLDGVDGFRRAREASRYARGGRRVRFEWTEEGLQLLATYANWLARAIERAKSDAPAVLRPYGTSELALFAASQAGLGSVRRISTVLGFKSTEGNRIVKELAAVTAESEPARRYIEAAARRGVVGTVKPGLTVPTLIQSSA